MRFVEVRQNYVFRVRMSVILDQLKSIARRNSCPYSVRGSIVIKTPEEGRKAVRDLKARGFAFTRRLGGLYNLTVSTYSEQKARNFPAFCQKQNVAGADADGEKGTQIY